MNFALLCDGTHFAVGWGAHTRSAKAQKNSFYINNFDLTQEPWLTFEHQEVLSLDDFNRSIWNEVKNFLPVAEAWEKAPRSDFAAQFQQAESRFGPDLRKILLSINDRAERRPLNKTNAKEGWPSSAPFSQRPSPLSINNLYFYAFHFDGAGAWGTTPELLLSWEEKTHSISTMALAGTFTEDVEDRHTPEHEEVVQFFREVARRNSADVEIKSKESVNFGAIKHLKSEIKISPALDLDHWIQELHPTPALGVSPRFQDSGNMQFLRELRKGLPEYFGAPMGYYGKWHAAIDSCKLVVMIRGTFFDKDTLHRPIGVGVTAASQLESEWQEIEIKRKALEGIWRALI